MFHPQSEKIIHFSPLLQSEETDIELSDSERPRIDTRRCRIPSIHNSLLLSIFTICILLLGFSLGRLSISNTSSWVSKITSYSPLLDDIPLSYTPTRFNGSFLAENIYRQPASPLVDSAWEALGINYRALRVPSSLASKSNLSPSHVQISSKYGGGYPANVEGLHHLHCLNLLRQSLWYNYPYYNELGQGAFQNEEFIVKKHVSHCVDILRQQLMCTVDVGVLGQVWVHKGEPKAFTDFNTRHMCRDFEAVRKWAEERQLPESVPGDFLKPPEREKDVFDEIP